jgi:hypothetical protein
MIKKNINKTTTTVAYIARKTQKQTFYSVLKKSHYNEMFSDATTEDYLEKKI